MSDKNKYKLDELRINMKDTSGRALTQSLFLEYQYNPQFAIFTFWDDDREYEGKTYISLKKLYLEEADPTEYTFAKKYLLGWEHWKRLNDNAFLAKHFNQWREELEVMLRSEAVQNLMSMDQNYQAQKFLAERGWEKNSVGRPKKVDPVREANIQEKIEAELKDTLVRMENYKEAV